MNLLKSALIVLSVVGVLAGLTANFWELHNLNKSIASLQRDGVWVHGIQRDARPSLRLLKFAPISVSGSVDVGNTVDVQGYVDVQGTVDIGNTVEVTIVR